MAAKPTKRLGDKHLYARLRDGAWPCTRDRQSWVAECLLRLGKRRTRPPEEDGRAELFLRLRFGGREAKAGGDYLSAAVTDPEAAPRRANYRSSDSSKHRSVTFERRRSETDPARAAHVAVP